MYDAFIHFFFPFKGMGNIQVVTIKFLINFQQGLSHVEKENKKG